MNDCLVMLDKETPWWLNAERTSDHGIVPCHFVCLVFDNRHQYYCFICHGKTGHLILLKHMLYRIYLTKHDDRL